MTGWNGGAAIVPSTGNACHSGDDHFDQLWAATGESCLQCLAEGIGAGGPSVGEAEGGGGVLEADLLRRPPSSFEFRQGGLRQVVENAAAAVVDRNNHRIAAGGQGQAAEVVLAGQVAEQGDDAAVDFSRPSAVEMFPSMPLAPRLP